MNREILFRGKQKDNGEWVCGTPIFYSRGTTVMCKENQRNENIDPKTVGQYTGLMDKNGKKIFEGDILNIDCYAYDEPETSYFGCIECDEFGYGLLTPDGRGGYTWYYMCDVRGSYITEYEICGNIHDNPELLEEPS